MTPKEAATEFWTINDFIREHATPDILYPDTRILQNAQHRAIARGRTDALAKTQNKFNPHQWAEYSIEHARLGLEQETIHGR